MQKIIHARPGVSGAGRRYEVTIEPGLLRRLPALLSARATDRTLFLISDNRVGRLYCRDLHRRLLAAGTRAILLSFPEGETSKIGSTAANLQTALLIHGIRRKDLVVVVGGGVAGDLGGFVAATILRGVEFIQIPTSLLAQVDSSVGGKVGIDHPLGKNLIGAFYQPSAVFIDPLVLRTLSLRQYRNGLAEVVKIAAALDEGFFRWLERHTVEINRRAGSVLTEMIARSIGLKAAVVGRDALDMGLRNVLNLGHTVGHAIEAGTDYRLLHGEAVSIGMATEARLAVTLGLAGSSDAERLIRLLHRLHLPAEFPRGIEKSTLWRALSLDKKGTRAGARFVLLRGIGKSVIGVPVTYDQAAGMLVP